MPAFIKQLASYRCTEDGILAKQPGPLWLGWLPELCKKRCYGGRACVVALRANCMSSCVECSHLREYETIRQHGHYCSFMYLHCMHDNDV